MRRPSPFILLILMAAVALAGCGAPQAAPAEVVVLAATQVPPTQTSPAAPSETTAEPAAASTPTARPGLEATDPTSVSLASGGPVLVEFFAFW
jgi:hypothetical protein